MLASVPLREIGVKQAEAGVGRIRQGGTSMKIAHDSGLERSTTDTRFGQSGDLAVARIPHVLVVERDLESRRELDRQLDQLDHHFRMVASVEEADSWLSALDFHLLICNVELPRASHFLRGFRTRFPKLPVILLAAPESVQTAIDWTGMLGRTHLTKPIHPEVLRLAIDDVLAVSLPIAWEETRAWAGGPGRESSWL